MSAGWAPSGSSRTDLRLILLGNIGCGKSSSADTILSQMSPFSLSASRSCQVREGRCEGRAVTVVEAPRWYWVGGKMEDSVKKETEGAMSLVAPGPHAVLLLVPVGQFTEMEARVPGELEDWFGKDVLDHTLVLLTCGDYLMGKKPEKYIQEEQGLIEVIRRCAGYHVFNNRRRQDREQVQDLFNKVDDIVKTKGIFHLKTVQEREHERQVNQRKTELLERFRAEKEEKEKAMASSLQNPKTFRGRDEYMDMRSKEERYVEEAVGMRHATKEFNSLTALGRQSETRSDRKVERTPSYRLNADGALLSKISEATSNPKRVSTYHHRLNSFDGSSPEDPPTSTSHSNVLYPLPPTFASSPSVVFSSSTPCSASSSLHISPSSSSEELRLVMLGRSGAGKSAAGNAILGHQEFESRPESLTSITQRCEKKKAVVGGRRVAVIDTPDWFNTEQSPDEVRAQVSSCVTLASPGPHAFLLCVPLDQPAKTELQALQTLHEVFGADAIQKHTLVLFTYADLLKKSGKAGNDSVESYIADQRRDLLKLVETCGDRFHVMEMEEGKKEKNVAELMEKVEQTMKEAGMEFYSCPAFQEAEDRVRKRQRELAIKKRPEKLEQVDMPYSYMKPFAEEEELRLEEIEKMRDEAEKIVGATNIESLPPITLSSVSPSLLRSVLDTMSSSAKVLPRLVSGGSVWVGEGAKKVKNSPVWGSVSRAAQNSHQMVAGSSVWGKVGATAGNVSKAVGDRVPKVVVDGTAWVGSGTKAVASSPVWGKVGSGAKKMADGSVRVGAGIGAGAKNIVQSPMWGKVGSGARSGAKLMADGSVKVGAGVAAGAKKVAQSPVWGKVGSGAKAGAKMVAESSVWEKIGNTAKQVPKVVVLGAVLGLLLGVFLGGTVGGVIGGAAGSAATEVGRRKFSNKRTKAGEAVKNVERRLDNSTDALIRQREKLLKTQ